MELAIIGAGVAGLAAASRLHASHSVTVYEAGAHAGGHTRTERVETAEGAFDVDTGFVVYNEATYPEFSAELTRLGVGTRPTSMGFSVTDRVTGLEYAGESLDALFAQRRNLLRPAFLRMIADIVRFNGSAAALEEGRYRDASLGELVAGERYSALFRDAYLLPMGAAIWSASEQAMERFPAAFFVRFFRNHGLLEPPTRQLRWRVVEGGSHRYVERLVTPFEDRIRLRTPVQRVRRVPGGVRVDFEGGHAMHDEVVLACHADQALALLADARPREREVLSAFPFQANDAVLHTDVSVLPRSRRAWASWNHSREPGRERAVSVTYDMSRLQGLRTRTPFLVTLNDPGRIAPERILRRIRFEHPVFTRDSIAAQARHGEISGADRVHFCGAYWRNGFHEDGWVSGIAVARAFERRAVA